jgi:hypothetical protein
MCGGLHSTVHKRMAPGEKALERGYCLPKWHHPTCNHTYGSCSVSHNNHEAVGFPFIHLASACVLESPGRCLLSAAGQRSLLRVASVGWMCTLFSIGCFIVLCSWLLTLPHRMRGETEETENLGCKGYNEILMKIFSSCGVRLGCPDGVPRCYPTWALQFCWL